MADVDWLKLKKKGALHWTLNLDGQINQIF